MPYSRIPSLNWLRVFDAAARTESFTAAARILNMSPSAVSQQIGALEGHLKAELFLREARSVRLSEAGYRFLPTVTHALSSLEATAALIFDRKGDEHLILQADTIFATSWLAPRLAGFEERNPGIRFNISCIDVQSGPTHAGTWLESADVMITFGPMPREWQNRTPLFSEVIYPVATPRVAAGIRSAADLLGHRLIEVTGHTWSTVLTRLGVREEDAASRDGAEAMTVSNSNVALSLAASEAGIALARAPATDWLQDRMGLVPCLKNARIQGEGNYVFASRAQSPKQDSIDTFRAWLLEESARQAS